MRDIDIADLCELLTLKYRVDFIIVDDRYKIVDISKGINRLFEKDISIGDDLYEKIYELIGYKSEFEDIHRGLISDFEIKSIYKNGYYIDIHIREFRKNESFVLFINDVTESIEKNQIILQDRNNGELLLRELAYKNQLLDRYKKASEKSILSIHLEKNFTIKDISTNFINLLNYTIDDLTKENINSILHYSSHIDKDTILSHMFEKKVYNATLQLNKRCGDTIFVHATFVPMCDDKHNINEIILFAHDITTDRKSSLFYEDKAGRDTLTNLLNRYGFEQKIDKLIKNGDEFTLLFMDLDLFKNINDTYGHYYGDCILSEVGDRLKSTFDDDTIIARYGGDEFIVIATDESQLHIGDIAKSIIKIIGKNYIINDKILQIGTSIGIAHYPKDATSRASLLQKADQAMYRAKKRGRNRYDDIGVSYETTK